jgi:hypothetical protein
MADGAERPARKVTMATWMRPRSKEEVSSPIDMALAIWENVEAKKKKRTDV